MDRKKHLEEIIEYGLIEKEKRKIGDDRNG